MVANLAAGLWSIELPDIELVYADVAILNGAKESAVTKLTGELIADIGDESVVEKNVEAI
jgi:hypothetical protein